MNRYELTYIIDTALEDSARKELVEKYAELIKQNGGEIEKVDETWGKRRLAYAINDMWEGWYVLVTFKSEGNVPKELERQMENSDKILRYLVIKLEEKKQSVKPRPTRVVPNVVVAEVVEAAQPAVEASDVEAAPETPAE